MLDSETGCFEQPNNKVSHTFSEGKLYFHALTQMHCWTLLSLIAENYISL